MRNIIKIITEDTKEYVVNQDNRIQNDMPEGCRGAVPLFHEFHGDLESRVKELEDEINKISLVVIGLNDQLESANETPGLEPRVKELESHFPRGLVAVDLNQPIIDIMWDKIANLELVNDRKPMMIKRYPETLEPDQITQLESDIKFTLNQLLDLPSDHYPAYQAYRACVALGQLVDLAKKAGK